MTERLTRIELSGVLGKKFGRVHEMSVHSPAQAVRALCVLLPGFERELMSSKDRGIAYAVFRGKTNIGEAELCHPTGQEKIRIAPVLHGAKSGGIFQTILGAALVVVGVVGDAFTDGATSPLIGLGLSMMAGGVMQMLSPQQHGLATQDSAGSGASYNFNGAVNTSAQGNPVPVLYGRAIVGSAVGSAGIYAHDQTWSPTAGASSTIAADALLSTSMARIVDIISEGPVRGPANGLQSFFLNGTPLINPDGSTNFPGCTVDYRLGTLNQDFMSGFPAVDNEIAVGAELTQAAPWTHVVTNTQVTSVTLRLAVPQLESTNQTTGQIVGYRIDYAVDLSTDGGLFQQIITGAFSGQASSEYQRSISIQLPRATTSWSIRVRRLTANANSAQIADTTNVVAVTETIDVKLAYPMSAIAGWQIDATTGASAYQNRSFDWYGRIISVPSNYDPDSRTYSGVWDGTFKEAWTDNPAWIFYDLVLNDLYGLGDRINASQVDKYGLYEIAQYCDVMVSDGLGGTEPRMTCNAYLQTQADAFKVLQDLAAIFRGIAYWSSGTVACVANMPRDPVYVYTNANIVGKFNYPGSPRTSRYTVALVSWCNPANAFNQVVEYVPDDDGIRRYGIRTTPITAFGCTSQGQAHRVGKWALLTSQMETGGTNFQVGLDGTLTFPGQVIEVADSSRGGRRFAGRLTDGDVRSVTVDSPPTAAAGDTLTVILPTGVAEKRTIQSINGAVIVVTADWTFKPVPQSIWMVETSDLVAQLFSVAKVDELDGIEYQITAAEYQPGKFDNIDNGTAIQPRPISIVPPSIQAPPANVRIASNNVIDQGIVKTNMTIAWDAAANAVAYIPEWMKDDGEWVPVPRTGSLGVQVSGIYQGRYLARVRAVNPLNVTSAPGYSVETQLQGKTTPPPAVTFLRTTPLVFAVQIDWGFPDGAGDTQRTEIWFSKTPDRAAATKLSDYAYPQATTTYQGLAAAQAFFFWARLVDTSGNIGPWSDMVEGLSSADESDYDAYFAGTINKSALGQGLAATIDAVEGLPDQMAALAEQMGDVQQSVDTVTGIVAQFNPPMAGSTTGLAGDATSLVGVWSEQSARAEADRALGKKLDTVAASIGAATAAVQVETAARIEDGKATAEQITTVQAQVADNVAAVQTVAQSYADLNGRVSASYQIKTQITASGRTYVAGIGVGVDNSSGIIESQVLLSASRVAIIDPNGSAITAPFVVQGGQVFISQALIGTGWITNAMIGSYIQSDNYVAGVSGWRLDKTGRFEINSVDGFGNRTVFDNNGTRTYDPNGTLRTREGMWT